MDISVQKRNPLLHFILVGYREGRNPHPLFDLSYYSEQHEDMKGQNVLLHYLQEGSKEDSNPSPVFHTKYYKKQLKAANIYGQNPLIHYLEKGSMSGFNPNPLFFSDYYQKKHSDVCASSLNPLAHYLRYGGFEGRAASPLFDSAVYLKKHPDLIIQKVNPLVHYFRYGHTEGAATTSIYSPSIALAVGAVEEDRQVSIKEDAISLSINGDDVIPIFCVYGPQHVEFIKSMSLFFFEKQQTRFGISIHFLNFAGNENLLGSIKNTKMEAHDWSHEKENRRTGFGESLNFLFRKVQPQKAFYIVNPDSYPLSECLQTMSDAICVGGVGIVEARQWPYEHPKEYDPRTGDTPWASGAFSLISADLFRRVNGFDEIFALYAEDVDLSWRFWLEGARVVYRPDAVCCHLTGHPGYRADRYYHEHFWSAVHFMVLSKKYFHEKGEQLAAKILHGSDYPSSFIGMVLNEYGKLKEKINCYSGKLHPKINIWGLNLYHLLKKDADIIHMRQDVSY
ncbi:MAG: hypothetical protein FJZ98_07845 [Chloroflexi bacterium]|nr:hypothetical protein [Chloroflexota bacterium]